MRNSKLIVSAAVAISAIAGIGAASAADLPARTYTKSPVMVDPAYNWSGFYVGGNVGGVWGSSNVVAFFDPNIFNPIFNPTATAKLTSSGFTGGGQAGYNHQFNPNWVAGVEADIDYTGLKTSRSLLAPGFPNQVDQSFKADWLSTIRGRLGYALDRVLFYGTGGLAVAHVNVYDATNFNRAFSSASTVRTGWTAGGGVEWAFAPSWSVKAEYLHVDLGTITTGALGAFIAPNPLTSISHKITEDIARVGANYRF